MNSFYGGKEGRTYHIVKTFNSVQNMATAFKQGAGYTDVAYGEYVMIATENRNYKDNGRIYRRGLNFSQSLSSSYQKPGGGAIYIGQIQGPDGRIPPMTIVDWDTFDDYGITQSAGTTFVNNNTTYKVVDKATTFSPPTTKKAYQIKNNTTYKNPIKIGYETYSDKDQLERKGIIGIDIPQPVVKINSTVAPASSSGTFTPITPTTLSQDLINQGIQFYEYNANIPIASNFEIKRTQGTNNNFSTYSLQYNTITSANNYGTASSTVDFSLVDGMRYAPNNTDLIQYHISGSDASTLNNGWRDLFNPNGQFHIYAKYDWTNKDIVSLKNTQWLFNEENIVFESPSLSTINFSIFFSANNIEYNNITLSNSFDTISIQYDDTLVYSNNHWTDESFRKIKIFDAPEDEILPFSFKDWIKENAELVLITDDIVIEKLNEDFPWGIRHQIDNTQNYDITQAGWLISVQLQKKVQNSGTGQDQIKTYSALYAYNYLPAKNYEYEKYTLNDFTKQNPGVHPSGWFRVQDFNSSLASDPEEIIIIGIDNQVTQSSFTTLKQNGLWLQGYEKGGKWWLQET